jgi:RNA polymerase sigma-70 factor (sigma-E family)
MQTSVAADGRGIPGPWPRRELQVRRRHEGRGSDAGSGVGTGHRTGDPVTAELAPVGPVARPAPLRSIDDLAAADAGVSALYRTHWTPMVRLAALLTRDASVAEEIVQDAFVRLHQRWSSLHDVGAAAGYLRTSVVNAARSAVRHQVVVERLRPLPDPPIDDPEQVAVRAARDAEVMAAVHALPVRQREVLVLRYFGDLSEQEIAQALGISRGSVKSHAHRGLSALRGVLDDPIPHHETPFRGTR